MRWVARAGWRRWTGCAGFLLALVAFPAAGRAASLADKLAVLPPQAAIEAPDFEVRTPDGGSLRLRDFRGQVVFLTFWATWCVPCRREMPAMEKLYREFRDQGFTIVALDLNEPIAAVRAFVKELGLTFPVGIDPAMVNFAVYGGRALPTSYLIGRDGLILGIVIGPREWDSEDARRYIESLLAKPRRP